MELENFTGENFNEHYFNFKPDRCIMNAYNIYDYGGLPNITLGENYSNSCSGLIAKGLY